MSRSPDGHLSVAEPVALSSAQGRWLLGTVVLGSGVSMLDATVVNIALPAIGRDLRAEFSGLQWTVNGYILTLAALILLGGSLGDRLGRRKVFRYGTAWFAVASLLCGLAPNVAALIAARLLQGVGGALLTPGSLALISASFREEDRGRAIGAWAGLTGIAAALGPVIGGLLVEISWRLVFLINLPLCVAVIVLAGRYVPESRDPQASSSLDAAGAVAGALGLAGVTYALVAAGEGQLSAPTWAAGGAGLASLALFVLVERRSPAPMLPLGLFASRQFTAANLVTFAVYAPLGVVLLLLVVQLQVTAGFPPLAAGSALIPVTALMLVLSSRSGALSVRIGPRLQMSTGPLLCSAGVLLLSRVDGSATYLRDVLPGVLLFGLGLVVAVAPLTVTVLAAAEGRYAGIASAVNNAVARTASLLAVAAVPLIAGISGTEYLDPVALTRGYRIAMLSAAGCLAVGGLLAAILIRNQVVAASSEAADGRR